MAMVEWGMAPLKALQAATATAPTCCASATSAGGGRMRADLVLYDGNPVDDIAFTLAPRTVWRRAWWWRAGPMNLPGP